MRSIVFIIVALAVAILTFPTAHAATETVLYAFKGGSDGASPLAELIADSAGNLYGTAKAGGLLTACKGGCGVVFELSPPKSTGKWTETVLYAFKAGKDGQAPVAGLVFDAKGALYGTTANGGGSSTCSGGCGTAFKLTPPATKGKPWTETVLYAFTGGADAESPLSGLIIDAKGALYGTTAKISTTITSACLGSPCGTAYRLTPPAVGSKGWTETVLHTFTGKKDGNFPLGGLIADKSGALYGTTALGGQGYCFGFGCGVVFRLKPPPAGKTSWTESVIHAFTGGPSLGGTNDGAYPSSDLIADASGSLYGVASMGPDNNCGQGCGSVFKLKPPALSGATGVESVLYGFESPNDSASSGIRRGRLTIGAGGTLFGTTPRGGGAPNCNSCGTMFELTPPAAVGAQWSEFVVYNFQGGADGSTPQAGLIAISGSFYGTTSKGGPHNLGTVFEVTP